MRTAHERENYREELQALALAAGVRDGEAALVRAVVELCRTLDDASAQLALDFELIRLDLKRIEQQIFSLRK